MLVFQGIQLERSSVRCSLHTCPAPWPSWTGSWSSSLSRSASVMTTLPIFQPAYFLLVCTLLTRTRRIGDDGECRDESSATGPGPGPGPDPSLRSGPAGCSAVSSQLRSRRRAAPHDVVPSNERRISASQCHTQRHATTTFHTCSKRVLVRETRNEKCLADAPPNSVGLAVGGCLPRAACSDVGTMRHSAQMHDLSRCSSFICPPHGTVKQWGVGTLFANNGNWHLVSRVPRSIGAAHASPLQQWHFRTE